MAKRINELSENELKQKKLNSQKKYDEHTALAQSYKGDCDRFDAELNRRIKARKSNEVIVPDHAVVRYLEKFMGVDVPAIRKSIQSEALPAVRAGATSVEIDNCVFKLKGNVVATVYPKSEQS